MIYFFFFLFFLCHPAWDVIFRTTLVHTVIVIILSTNAIQFYCVISRVSAVISYLAVIAKVKVFALSTPRYYIYLDGRPGVFSSKLRLSVSLKGTALGASQPPERASVPVHYPNHQTVPPTRPVIRDWCQVDSFSRFVVSVSCKKNALFTLGPDNRKPRE